MKILLMIFFAVFATGCTTYSISNKSLLDPIPYHFPSSAYQLESEIVLQDLPLFIKSSMYCVKKDVDNRNSYGTCSNKYRVQSVIKQFKDRGIKVLGTDDESAARITIEEIPSSESIRLTTSLLNLITLGLFPIYDYEDYTVSFSDPNNNIDIIKTFRISSVKSWFSLFMPNPDNTDDRGWKNRALQNQIRLVLDEAKLGVAPNT